MAIPNTLEIQRLNAALDKLVGKSRNKTILTSISATISKNALPVFPPNKSRGQPKKMASKTRKSKRR